MIILPKILQPHDEKENRSIEKQLNEAKILIMCIAIALSVYFGVFIALILASISLGTEIEKYIKYFRDFVSIFEGLTLIGVLITTMIKSTGPCFEKNTHKN